LHAEIRLPALVAEGAVLQRDKEVVLRGWASPGEKVSLELSGEKYLTVSGEDGRWHIDLPPHPAGGPHILEFSGKNRIRVGDVYFGDVWVCSGQSNMVLPMERVKERYPGEPSGEGFPLVRHFFIPTTPAPEGTRADLPQGEWIRAIPGEAMDFSAVAYFFAREIHRKYGIPIGLVNASVGGTPIEAWMSPEALQKFPELLAANIRNQDRSYVDSMLAIQPPHPSADPERDAGLNGEIPWYDPSCGPKGWARINIPGYWEDQGLRELDGVVWYRREIEVPASMTGMQAKLFLGRIVDADEVYVNGTRVGNITYQYPPRRYDIPAGILVPGKNTLVVRVMNYRGKGGFVPDKPYSLEAGGRHLDLKGDWYYRVGLVFQPGSFPERTYSLQKQPAVLYNGMVAPLAGMAIKGFIWYQGESNAENPEPYGEYLKTLIRDWREKWGRNDLPFLYVQLANFMAVDHLPAESNWALLREAQRGALVLPNTGMAVAIDLGEWNDIHPLNKEDVGRRLALGAMHLAYGEEHLVWSGPLFHAASLEKNRVLARFTHTGGGLVSRDGEALRHFALAGEDGQYHWAKARIVADAVEIWHDSIPEPRSLRYAWADNPRGANLGNLEGLPASPFQVRLSSTGE
jgi:sialate O-acetylesterase